MKKVLTDRTIAALKPAAVGRRYIVNDALVPGLGVRVTDRGHRTFVLGARYPGSPHFKRREIGEVGAITLAAARDRARMWLGQIKAGLDPREVEAAERRAASAAVGNTFATVAEEFISRHVKGQRKAAVVAREIRNELIPLWGERPITQITRRDVVELIEAIVDRPARTYAHNVLGHVRTLFNWAINRDIYGLEASPCDRLKPKALIGPKKPRTRVLNDKELRALWHASDAIGYPFGPMIKVLMLTGSRLNEVAGACWREFDFEGKLWTIPADRFKSEAQHAVPLSDDVIAVLNGLPRWRGDALFSTTEGSKPVNGFSKAKQRVDKLIGDSPHWVIHDIRRTVRTRLSELRVPEHIAELVIGHARRGLSRVYDQYTYDDEKRSALDSWASRLRLIVDPPPPNVVPLREAV